MSTTSNYVRNCSRGNMDGSHCPCQNDEKFGSDGECPICFHYKKHHLAAKHSPQYSYEARVLQSRGSATHPRSSTIKKITDMMFQHKIVQIRATPASGKTTLLDLLNIYINHIRPDYLVHQFVGWPRSGDRIAPSEWNKWQGWLASRLGLTDSSQLSDPSHNIVILLDEGQDSYWDLLFWHTFLKTKVNGLSNVYVIIASCYGSFSGGDDQPWSITPVMFPSEAIVQPYAHGTKPGVFFTESEYHDVVEIFRKRVRKIEMKRSFQNSLFYLTGGHCGTIYTLLEHMFTTCSAAKRAELDGYKLVNSDILNAKNMSRLEELVQETMSLRGVGLPEDPTIMQEKYIRKVLQKVCIEGKFDVKHFDKEIECAKAVRLCEEKGWITREIMSPSSHVSFYAFPTGLHHWYFNYKFFKSTVPLDPNLALKDLVFRALKRLSCNRLKGSEDDRNSLKLTPCGIMTGPHRNPEAPVYQNEIYQIIYGESQGAMVASPEVFIGLGNRPGQQERLDFLIRGTKSWAIEALIKGSEPELVEHYERFVGNGKYTTVSLDDFILLNFTKALPTRTYPNFKKTYHVVFSNDFVRARVYSARTLELQFPEFYLSP